MADDVLPDGAETYVVSHKEIKVSPAKFEELGLDPDEYTSEDWDRGTITTQEGTRAIEPRTAYRDGADRVIFPEGAPLPEALARELAPAFHERIEARDGAGEPIRWPFTFA